MLRTDPTTLVIIIEDASILMHDMQDNNIKLNFNFNDLIWRIYFLSCKHEIKTLSVHVPTNNKL